MIEVECGGCGVVFGMPDRLYENLRRTGKSFTCPNGCTRHFIVEPTPEQKRLAQLEDELARRVGQAWDVSAEWQRCYREALDELRRCPICGESTGRARSVKTIKARMVEHLTNEHGARARLRAIERATGVSS
jgi:hypothetical protein